MTVKFLGSLAFRYSAPPSNAGLSLKLRDLEFQRLKIETTAIEGKFPLCAIFCPLSPAAGRVEEAYSQVSIACRCARE